MDRQLLRSVFGTFATGVTVVTVGGAGAHGMTVNSFTSVSLDPPLALVCARRTARIHDKLRDAGVFAVSVLAAGQEAVARWFADPARPRGPAQFRHIPHVSGASTDAPLICGALAWLEFRLWRMHEAGDHSIFLGQLLSLQRLDNGGPLLFVAGDYSGPFDDPSRAVTAG